MATLLPHYDLSLVHLPLRAPQLSGHCAVACLTHYDDLEFVANVGFMSYLGATSADDIRMALKNLGGSVHLAHVERPISAWDKLPVDEISLVGCRHRNESYWLVWNPYISTPFFDPSLLRPQKTLPLYLSELDAKPSVLLPVHFT